jgi:hypothetical protein
MHIHANGRFLIGPQRALSTDLCPLSAGCRTSAYPTEPTWCENQQIRSRDFA